LKTPAHTRQILEALATQHPGADTELHYRNAFELLVATILSAQSTDQRVNQVTPTVFTQFPDAQALARATTAELEPLIHSTGFFRAKSKALIGMAQGLVREHGGEVPPHLEQLTALPGVGRKTANVVLGHALNVPGLPVDRHVLRVSNRLGIADSDDPVVVEEQLCRALPAAEWTRASDTLILHGRRVCKPRPACDRCVVQSDCAYYQRGGNDERGRASKSARGVRGGRLRRRARRPAVETARGASSQRTRGKPKRSPKSRKR
jgi:endonuclease-3